MRLRKVWSALFGVAVFACAAPALADEVPVALQDTVEAAIGTHFTSPQTARWRFDGVKPYVLGDRVVCGYVNFQSAGQHYLGFHQFYAIIHEDAVSLAQISDPSSDASGQLAAKLYQLCGPATQQH